MESPKSLKARNLELYESERAQKKTAFESYPPSLQLELTTRCNQSCPICARNYYDRSLNPPTDMSMALLEKLEPAIARAKDVVLGGYGEPLIAKNFAGAVRFLKDRSCEVEVITGVVPLESKELRELVAGLGVDRLRLSVDGTTDETLARLRGISAARAFAIVNELSKLATGGRPKLSINFTANLVNISELPRLVEMAADWNVSSVSVFFQKIYTRAQAHISVFLDPARTAAEIERARDVAARFGIELNAPDVTKREVPCAQPLEFLFICADGEVLGCCSGVFKGHPWRLALGRIEEADIHELWNHPALQSFRKAFYEGRPELYPEPCRACAFRVHSIESYYRFLNHRAGRGKP